jgi:hypothetical protein
MVRRQWCAPVVEMSRMGRRTSIEMPVAPTASAPTRVELRAIHECPPGNSRNCSNPRSYPRFSLPCRSATRSRNKIAFPIPTAAHRLMAAAQEGLHRRGRVQPRRPKLQLDTKVLFAAPSRAASAAIFWSIASATASYLFSPLLDGLRDVLTRTSRRRAVDVRARIHAMMVPCALPAGPRCSSRGIFSTVVAETPTARSFNSPRCADSPPWILASTHATDIVVPASGDTGRADATVRSRFSRPSWPLPRMFRLAAVDSMTLLRRD